MNNIILHILKRCLQFFLIFIVCDLIGKVFTRPIVIENYIFFWFSLIPAALFVGIMARDNVIRYKRKKRGDNTITEYNNHPIVILFIKRFLQLFFMIVALTILVAVIIITVGLDGKIRTELFNYVGIISMCLFAGLIVWDLIQFYKGNSKAN